LKLSLIRNSAVAGVLLGMFAAQAQAASIRVTCEKRGDRSVVSVDGKNLARGTYSAQVVSAGNAAASRTQAAVGDEVEFDFSSQPNDIAAGATAVAPNFIVSGSATGKIVDASGNTVIADTVACRVRNR
jgi:hypothetical protein